MIGASAPANIDVTWYPMEIPVYRILVGNISDRNAACGPYMSACATNPRVRTSTIAGVVLVLKTLQAKIPHRAEPTRPAAMTGLRPIRSDRYPKNGTANRCTKWAINISCRMVEVLVFTTTLRYV